ncbi:MAG TPA: NAD-dependent deacylase [candidate division Zixibacteria bacterium]|nr:NAD-dependent deacylase [candidate division Zixibacteria bacterium]
MRKKKAVKFVAITGSGISKGSGIPTFRGKDGLWKNYNAMDLATPQAFKRNPQLVWEWYAWRIDIISSKKPNSAHYALVDLQKKNLLNYIITQNVDSLHFRSGSKNLLEVHGNIFRTRCENCGKLSLLTETPKEPPICDCGTMVRPDVVWFGETLDQKIITKAYEIISSECDVLLVIGTSGIVYPIAEFPFIAKSHGALILEFNLEKTPISRIADFTIIGKSEEMVPIFVEKIINEKAY